MTKKNQEEHRHIIEKRKLEKILDSEASREKKEEARMRLEILDGIIDLASRLSKDRDTGLCYEDVCTVITEII